MSDVPFYKTIMGKRFFEGQVPQLIEAISKLSSKLDSGIIGRTVEFGEGEEKVKGKVLFISNDFTLLVGLENGMMVMNRASLCRVLPE